MSWLAPTLATVAIIALSAFFVAVEFSLINAKRHRLEGAAETSGPARAALRNASELTLLLAGAQLGITVCTLALGAITKPAVHHALMGPLALTGLPTGAADVVAFLLALVLVTFLHLVVGEMAPKSWAIAHPERSAILLAVPMRVFLWLTRPALRLLNHAANALVRRAGVEPVDEVDAVQDEHGLRALVAHSSEAGVLEEAYRSPLANALDMSQVSIGELTERRRPPTAVDADATVGEVQEATVEHQHLRVLLLKDHAVLGVVHVRDTLGEPDERPARELARDAFTIEAATPLHEAFARMRETSTQLAVVHREGRFVGVVTMSDILPRFFPRAETSTVST